MKKEAPVPDFVKAVSHTGPVTLHRALVDCGLRSRESDGAPCGFYCLFPFHQERFIKAKNTTDYHERRNTVIL